MSLKIIIGIAGTGTAIYDHKITYHRKRNQSTLNKNYGKISIPPYSPSINITIIS